MSDSLYNKISLANITYSLFSENDKILVALSGGADSVALLLALKKYFPKLNLFACHVNHMLRADEADRDSDFAHELCAKNNIPFELLKIDVAEHAARKGLSTELAAREIRYEFFKKICDKYGIKNVATAHTLTDNAETVLFNLSRGTSISGLCGIPPKRELSGDINIIRPLIFATRTEIEDYLSSQNQTYMCDSTNLTDDYTRNYFRHHVIPAIQKINPSFEENLSNTCTSLKEINTFLDDESDALLTNNVSKLCSYNEAIIKRIIIKLYKQYSGNSLIESYHINKISELLFKANNNQSNRYEICLPNKISAIIKNGCIDFCETIRQENNRNITANSLTKLKYGFNYLKSSDFVICITEPDDKNKNLDGYSIFDDITISVSSPDELFVRFRNTGDSIKSGKHTKKLKELFIHEKIPADLRNLLPIVCDSEEILYIPGIAIADKCKIGEKNVRIIIYSKTTP